MKNSKRFESLPMLFFLTVPFLYKQPLPAWANWILIGFSVLMLVYAIWSLENTIKNEEKQ